MSNEYIRGIFISASNHFLKVIPVSFYRGFITGSFGPYITYPVYFSRARCAMDTVAIMKKNNTWEEKTVLLFVHLHKRLSFKILKNKAEKKLKSIMYSFTHCVFIYTLRI